MKRKFAVLVFSLIANYSLKAQSDSSSFYDAFDFDASYIGDNVNNFNGGIKRGSVYLGMANFRLLFDTEKGGLWAGTQFFVNAVNTHGAKPSSELLGDMQVASNIEAGNHTYLQEFWVKQTFGGVEFTLGLQDLNVEFAASENAALFINSSFGILPVISGNIPAPIFPLTSLGLTSKWSITPKASWLFAVYDGSPTHFDYNPYNLKWQFASGDGILAITEFHKSLELNNYPGTFKIGVYTHNHFVESKFNASFTDSLKYATVGAYFYADQILWQLNEKSIGLFGQFGYSPSKSVFNRSYYGMGINFTGMFSKSKTDIFGLAFAHANFSNNFGSETIVELTYQRQITEHVFIQPDLQYIINPSGHSTSVSNCLVGTLRFGFSF